MSNLTVRIEFRGTKQELVDAILKEVCERANALDTGISRLPFALKTRRKETAETLRLLAAWLEKIEIVE